MQKEVARLWVMLGLPLMILVFLHFENIIGDQLFLIGCVVAIVVSGYFLFRRLRRDPSLVETPRRLQPITTRKKVVVSGILVWVAFCMWITRGEPWLPRLTGASVVLFITFGTLIGGMMSRAR